MDRIEPFGSPFNLHSQSGEKPKTRKTGKKQGLFAGLVRESERSESGPVFAGLHETAGSLEEILDHVHEAGDRLKSDLTLKAVHDYREAVKRFLGRVVSECYALDERTSGASVLKRKKFVMIRIVNEKLERLAAEVLSAHREQLNILRRVDEIHGLLIDLLK